MLLRCHHLSTSKLVWTSLCHPMVGLPTALTISSISSFLVYPLFSAEFFLFMEESAYYVLSPFTYGYVSMSLCTQSRNLIFVKPFHRYCWFLNNVVIDFSQ